MTFDYQNPVVRQRIYGGKFGLERETLRVDADGHLAQTRHPFGDDERISRDFCENQVEIITPPVNSAREAVDELAGLHMQVVETLKELPTGAEYLWPFSNPPRISGEDEIPVARFDGSQTPKMTYREYLAAKYGKRKMLFCGIHCNYSFEESLLQEEFAHSTFSDFQTYKNSVYLSLAQKLAEYGWLIVYLTAASPVSDPSLFDEGIDGDRYASARCGEHGYWNNFVPVFDYGSIEAYTESIWRYIREGAIVSPSELYYPIRLKPEGENRLDHLRDNGVNHIELRMLDVNPLTPAGIFEQDISFVRLLIIYLMSLEDNVLNTTAQKIAVNNFKRAALYGDYSTFVDVSGRPYTADYYRKPIRDAAADLLNDIRVFFVSLDAPAEVFEVLAYQQNKLRVGWNRYAVRIRETFGQNFTEKVLALAKEYAGENDSI